MVSMSRSSAGGWSTPARYLFQERGMIPVKGKGKMLTYFLGGRAPKHGQMLDLTEPH
jgi:hypothetical protein